MIRGQKIKYKTREGVLRDAEFIEFGNMDTCEIKCLYTGTVKIIFNNQITENESNEFLTL